ncbi:hypothetical protein DFH06DRAFT_1325259 [Mycena polygramma]|nr:hypothetical protein DFH06DRAFT_1325259 [Mycena polygramma]
MSTPFRVRKLDPSTAIDASDPGSLPEMNEVEGVLGRAFTGDLFTALVTGHNPADPDNSYIGPFWKTTVVAGLLGGEVYVAETADTGKIIGCAVWFGPGHTMYDSEEQQKHSLGPLMASFDKELQNWWVADFLPKYDTFLASVIGEGTKHAAWHLQTLAVDPAFQRQGAGTCLVKTVAEKAALSGTQLCVECEKEMNIDVYTKMGFHLMPKDNTGYDTCKETFTGVKGHTMSMWVLVMD